MKQKQHHPKHRAPRGNPTHTKRITFRCSPALFAKFNRRGGSEWGRNALTAAE